MSIELDPKINLGHILIVIGMIGSGVSAYVANKLTLNEHAMKLEVLQDIAKNQSTSIEKQGVRTDDMNNALWGIKSDIAIIKQRVEGSLNREPILKR